MARILVHALAATSGGGLTYFRNLMSYLAEHGRDHEWVILKSPELPVATAGDHMTTMAPVGVGSGLRRAFFDQWKLRQEVDRLGIDLILATANFGMIRPPVPQILLNRNALYFSRDHIRELRRRRAARELIQTLVRRQLALASVRSSVVNIVPTAAFGREIGDYLSPGEDRSFEVIPFGIHHVTFANSTPAGRARVEARLSTRPGVQRILLVSHYNYFRNFDTLLAAVALLKRRYARPVELVLTTRLAEGHWEHRYDTSASARRLGSLGLSEDVTMLGPVPHDELADLYALADVVVCPSYAESFGHPMVEAMASGRPVVASKRGVHREICGEAAVYFSTFDADDLAGRLADLLSQPAMADELGRLGRERSRAFSWPEHFGRLIEVVQTTLAEKQNARVSV